MKRLKQIMQIKDYEEKLKQLNVYGKELGVSVTRLVGAEKIDGKTEDAIMCERIQQALIIEQGQKSWIIALISAIVSIIGALAAWAAVLKVHF